VTANFDQPAREWSVCQTKSFGVSVRAWSRGRDQWTWNVYALIYDNHPLHKNVQGALALPFHGGPTLDVRVVTSPAQGLRYEWQRVSDVLKVGSDYAHAYDEWAMESDPTNGVPYEIRRDAEELIAALAAAGEQV
jgi:hypothetical protein